jgi:type IV pilus assembly protein PilA
MQDIIARMRAKKQDEGFTLIELLVVVVIIGVLVAIAVPVYLNYRKGAADKSAQSDVRGAISAIEQYYTESNNKYPEPFANAKAEESPVLIGVEGENQQKITLSDKTEMTYVGAPDSDTYRVCAKNEGGSGKVYVYNSEKGGSVTADDVSIDTCE